MEEYGSTAIDFVSFWDWFQEHLEEFNTLRSPDQPFWDTALEKLKRVDKRLWFELSSADIPPREFVVTAEGIPEAFPIAEGLVNIAPRLQGWLFVALKPAMGFNFTTRYEGVLYDPSRMWFLPLESAARPLNLGLRIGIEGLQSLDRNAAHNATLIILDTALGERSSAIDIQYTEIVELPAAPETLGYIELPELASYIAWRNRKLGQLAH